MTFDRNRIKTWACVAFMGMLSMTGFGAETGAAVWEPGSSFFDGERLMPFRATYESAFGITEITFEPTQFIDGSELHHVLVKNNGGGIVVDIMAVDRKTLALKYRSVPLGLGGEKPFYFVGFFHGNHLMGGGTPLQGEAFSIREQLEGPVYEPSLIGLVFGAADLKKGMHGRVPFFDGRSKRLLADFRVEGKEKKALPDGRKLSCHKVVVTWAKGNDETMWIASEAPYLVQRERTIGGQQISSNLVKLANP